MATEIKHQADRAGDWGTPAAANGGAYREETLALTGGSKLFFRAWVAADTTAPVLVLAHGLGAHSGWFIDMGNELSARGLTVYVPDHRHFGRSDGARGHVTSWAPFPQDLNAFLDEVQRRQQGAPLFLLGHSMGALFTTYVAAEDARSGRNRLAGIVLLNPWVKDQSKIPVGQQLGIAMGGLRKSAKLGPNPFTSRDMTGNEEAQRMLEADTYWVRQESQSFLYQVGLLMRGGVLKQAKEVRAPALVAQAAGDVVVVQAATRRLYDTLGSKDKSIKTYPGYMHDSQFEVNRTALDDDLAAWINAHCA